MKKASIALAIALSFGAASLHAQTTATGTVSELVRPIAGRQALPLGSVIKGGVNTGQAVVGAEVVLPGQHVLRDVVIRQVTRDASGRVLGGTISDRIAIPLPAPAPTATTLASGPFMSGQISYGVIAAAAIGAAVVLGGGGSSTSHHGGN